MLIFPAGCSIFIAVLLLMMIPGWLQQSSEQLNPLGGLVLTGLAIIDIAVSLGPANSTDVAASLASEYAVVAVESEFRHTPNVLVTLPQN